MAKGSMKRTILMDTDIIAYRIALANQQETSFGRAVWTMDEVVEMAEFEIKWFNDKFNPTHYFFGLSDGPQGGTNESSQIAKYNFRYGVLPTYKANRANTERPELLKMTKEYLAAEYPSGGLPGCEADDVIGIYMTHDHAISGKKLAVSEDKDFRTFPGQLFAPHRPQLGIQKISPLDADRFHMWQTICGDPTDGYIGAKGVGKGSPYAQDVIFAETAEEMWDEVLMAYALKGLTEDDAIQQARVARILRAEDYNFETGEIELWNPTKLLGW